jgi:hypothetical protein
MNQYNIVQYEKESFGPVSSEAAILNQKLQTIFRVSNDFYKDIIEETNNGKYNLLLIGIGQSIYEGSGLGRALGFINALVQRDRIIKKVTGKERLFEYSAFEERNRFLFEGSDIPVGIFVNKKFTKCEQLLISITTKADIFIIDYALLIFENTACQITIYDPEKIIFSRQQQIQSLQRIIRLDTSKVNIITAVTMRKEQLQKHDLLFVSVVGWKDMLESEEAWFKYAPSTLILKDRN